MSATAKTAQVTATSQNKFKLNRLIQSKYKTGPRGKHREPQPIEYSIHEKWFLSLSKDEFALLCTEWNTENLSIELPNLKDYDQWLNYFKTLSPTIIRKLATTGLDALSTEAYAALSRWHDIISNPHRIEKIHRSGLTYNDGKPQKSIAEVARNNDRLGVLQATRDRIAEKLDKGAGAGDTAALTRQMTDIMQQHQ